MSSLTLPRSQAMTSQLGAVYPWHFDGGFAVPGPVLGIDLVSGGGPFTFDPFEAVMSGFATNPNVMISGEPGQGKSTWVKAMIGWLVGAFGYRAVVMDPKGEYADLGRALGMELLELHPDTKPRVNPLSSDGSIEGNRSRVSFVQAIASVMLGRALLTVEQVALYESIEIAAQRRTDPILEDLVEVLQEAPAELCRALGKDRETLLDATDEVRYGLRAVVYGPFAGMFSARDTVPLDSSTPGLVLDISRAVAEADEQMLNLSLLTGLRAVRQLMGTTVRRTFVVADELWQAARTADAVSFLVSSWKLGRQSATSNVGLLHRFSDLAAQTADGTATSKRVASLVRDTAIHVMFRHKPIDAQQACDELSLPGDTADLLRQLPPRRALVTCNSQVAVVEAVLPARLGDLTYTNTAMQR